jgi:DNA-binding response OmpR family regulator
MADEVIMVIEREGGRAPTFASALQRKDYRVEVVTTGGAALTRAGAARPAVIILNAASLGSTGIRICHRLRQAFDVPIIHIVQDARAIDPADTVCDILLPLPFTARKLINRIEQLWPTSGDDTIQVGPVEFIKRTRVVRADARDTRLTPKSADLLEVFLHNPGKTLDRAFLMRQVWDTNYTGDTRTLDVHVRWVRQAIEPDPAVPQHIKTVRGIGYRFDQVPPAPHDDGKT